MNKMLTEAQYERRFKLIEQVNALVKTFQGGDGTPTNYTIGNLLDKTNAELAEIKHYMSDAVKARRQANRAFEIACKLADKKRD